MYGEFSHLLQSVGIEQCQQIRSINIASSVRIGGIYVNYSKWWVHLTSVLTYGTYENHVTHGLRLICITDTIWKSRE